MTIESIIGAYLGGFICTLITNLSYPDLVSRRVAVGLAFVWPVFLLYVIFDTLRSR